MLDFWWFSSKKHHVFHIGHYLFLPACRESFPPVSCFVFLSMRCVRSCCFFVNALCPFMFFMFCFFVNVLRCCSATRAFHVLFFSRCVVSIDNFDLQFSLQCWLKCRFEIQRSMSNGFCRVLFKALNNTSGSSWLLSARRLLCRAARTFCMNSITRPSHQKAQQMDNLDRLRSYSWFIGQVAIGK